MLMLLFYVGDERYTLSGRRVVEVVPLVALKKLYHAPEYVAGLFNYRNRIVPVLDLCRLICGEPCQTNLSTRIILVNYLEDNTSISNTLQEQNPHILGLMAERVTETLDMPESEFVDSAIKIDAAPYLGKILRDEQGMIQCLRVEYLLPESQRAYLLPAQENSTEW